jgi:phage recombination protein Bet
MADTINGTLSADEELLWKSKYHECSREEFLFLKAFCGRHNLDMWARPVYPKFRDAPGSPGHRTMELELTIEGLRTIAARTGEYMGNLPGAKVEVSDKGELLAVTAYARRATRGEIVVFVATVEFEEANQKTGLWLSRPKTMLKKCAEAAALRMAFPEQLGGVYVDGELPSRMGPAPQRAGPDADDIERHGVAPDDDTPTSKMQFELKLIHEFGFGDPTRRLGIIQGFRDRYPHLLQNEDEEPPRRFYATVLYHLASEPERYGVKTG